MNLILCTCLNVHEKCTLPCLYPSLCHQKKIYYCYAWFWSIPLFIRYNLVAIMLIPLFGMIQWGGGFSSLQWIFFYLRQKQNQIMLIPSAFNNNCRKGECPFLYLLLMEHSWIVLTSQWLAMPSCQQRKDLNTAERT